MAQHTVMPKKLAQALMEAGMTHFDAGGQQPGQVQALGAQNTGTGGPGGFTPTGDGRGLGEHSFQESAQNQFGGYQSPQLLAQQGGNSLGQGINGAGGIMKDAARAFTNLNEYQASAPGIATQNYNPQIQNLQNQQQSTYNQQQGLANALLAQSQGYGPNPAMAQFNQNTGANVAQQGALMAGQRGASSNVGLLARQAAQQGAQTQQNATGQAATLQANQQLAAQQALGQTYGNMANQSLQGESIQQGGQAAQNTAITTGQLGAQNINANIAGQNASALNGTAGGISNALGAGLANALSKGGYVRKMADGGIAHYDSPQAAPINMTNWQNQGLQIQAPKINPKEESEVEDATSDKESPGLVAGGPGDAGSVDKNVLMAACGGKIPNYDEGGDVQNSGAIGEIGMDTPAAGAPSAPAPLMGLDNFGNPMGQAPAGGNVVDKGISAAAPGGGGGGGGLGGLMALLASGGNVPKFSRGLLGGGGVPGKAKVKGDSQTNDTEPTLLSPGEIVLPRSVTQAPDMERKAIEFLRHLKKKGKV